MRKVIKILRYLFGFLLILCIGIGLSISFIPSFGGNPSKEQQEGFGQYANFLEGSFSNEVLGPADPDSWVYTDENATAVSKERSPSAPIPVSPLDWQLINSDEDSLTWFGHSAFLFSIDNKKLLVDPMLGPIASPVPFAGVKRYPYSSDILENIFEELPPIDAVLISHDHYDHLDYASILGLKDKAAHFFVPLGVSSHLIRWGIPEEKITELSWWEEREYQGITLALTPARHFSGRGLFNQNSTLWGGWILSGNSNRLFISGDGGYGEHFKEIGQRYGPFDLALIEGGQYDSRWPNSHMTPEQAVQANLDVGGKQMMLMHWGTFTLANHGWNEPIERAVKEAQKREVDLIAPKIGETVPIDSDLQGPLASWWELDKAR